MSGQSKSIGGRRQAQIYRAGLAGRRPLIPVDVAELERQALRRMSTKAAAYFAGGAGGERTMAANRAALDRAAIVPRMLRGASRRDTSVEVLGRTWPVPFALAPIGVLELAHREADVACARAADAAGVAFVASSQSSVPMEAIADALTSAPKWFQLYWSSRDDLTTSFVRRAEAAGYEAIVLTLDTTELGWRPRDLSLGSLPFLEGKGIANYRSDPVFRRMVREMDREPPGRDLAAVLSALRVIAGWPDGPVDALRNWPHAIGSIRCFVETYSRPDLSWSNLPFLRAATRLPIVLKGILHADDAKLALDHGVDGIIVSNHGGRQVDGAIAALDALPGVVEAVDGRIPVLLDSGIRTGADVVKALAVGARAVLLGRPYAYALAVGGERGVAELIANLAAEIDLKMGLMGYEKISQLSKSHQS